MSSRSISLTLQTGVPRSRRCIRNLRACASSTKIRAYDKRIDQMARASETAQRLMKLEGVGALTAAAIVAAAGYGKQFANGRQFAAWLGLVPREYSSGREVRRGRISKRGDAHLRTLLIHGVRVIYRYLGEKSPRITPDIKLMPDATEYDQGSSQQGRTPTVMATDDLAEDTPQNDRLLGLRQGLLPLRAADGDLAASRKLHGLDLAVALVLWGLPASGQGSGNAGPGASTSLVTSRLAAHMVTDPDEGGHNDGHGCDAADDDH